MFTHRSAVFVLPRRRYGIDVAMDKAGHKRSYSRRNTIRFGNGQLARKYLENVEILEFPGRRNAILKYAETLSVPTNR